MCTTSGTERPARGDGGKASSARSLGIAAAVGLSVAACQPDLRRQPRVRAQGETPAFADGQAARLPVAGTIAREDLVTAAEDVRPAVTPALLARGRERFNVFCAPCHGFVGLGDGLVVRHGYPTPPSFHIDRLKAASDDYWVGVIKQGAGFMPPYGKQVARADRWAITAYVRALQASQDAAVCDLPPDKRSAFGAAAAGCGKGAP